MCLPNLSGERWPRTIPSNEQVLATISNWLYTGVEGQCYLFVTTQTLVNNVTPSDSIIQAPIQQAHVPNFNHNARPIEAQGTAIHMLKFRHVLSTLLNPGWMQKLSSVLKAYWSFSETLCLLLSHRISWVTFSKIVVTVPGTIMWVLSSFPGCHIPGNGFVRFQNQSSRRELSDLPNADRLPPCELRRH